jgi:hypothetical protein
MFELVHDDDGKAWLLCIEDGCTWAVIWDHIANGVEPHVCESMEAAHR